MNYTPFTNYKTVSVSNPSTGQVLYTTTRKSLVSFSFENGGGGSLSTIFVELINIFETQKIAEIDTSGIGSLCSGGSVVVESGRPIKHLGNAQFAGTLHIFELD